MPGHLTHSSKNLPASVSLMEVGARDGLQNQSKKISAELRAQLVHRLAESGLRRIETGSFVSPKAVPQMADSDQVFALLKKKSGVVYSALTPNQKGFDAAIAAGADEVAVFASASEGFSQKNINCSIAESIKRFEPIIAAAKQHHIHVRGYVSCVMDCPYDGEINPQSVVDIATEMWNMGCYEISLGDTIGTGTPLRAKRMLAAVNKHIPVQFLAAHFHNTYGQALTNIYALLEEGLSIIDASIAGLGGCPYAPGASGNVATEDVVYMLEGMGIDTGINMSELLQTARFIQKEMGIQSSSNAGIALNNKKSK